MIRVVCAGLAFFFGVILTLGVLSDYAKHGTVWLEARSVAGPAPFAENLAIVGLVAWLLYSGAKLSGLDQIIRDFWEDFRK